MRRRVRKLLHRAVEQDEVLAVVRLPRAQHREPGSVERKCACRSRDVRRAVCGVHIQVWAVLGRMVPRARRVEEEEGRRVVGKACIDGRVFEMTISPTSFLRHDGEKKTYS